MRLTLRLLGLGTTKPLNIGISYDFGSVARLSECITLTVNSNSACVPLAGHFCIS